MLIHAIEIFAHKDIRHRTFIHTVFYKFGVYIKHAGKNEIKPKAHVHVDVRQFVFVFPLNEMIKIILNFGEKINIKHEFVNTEL